MNDILGNFLPLTNDKKLTQKESEIVMFCLNSLASRGSYEGGEVRAYEEIAEEFNIKIKYDEMYYMRPE